MTAEATHPEYLDDDGLEGVQFVRHDLAATEDEARAYVLEQSFYDRREDVADAGCDVVWMKPVGEGVRGDDWYDVVPEAEGVVRYWRLRP